MGALIKRVKGGAYMALKWFDNVSPGQPLIYKYRFNDSLIGSWATDKVHGLVSSLPVRWPGQPAPGNQVLVLDRAVEAALRIVVRHDQHALISCIQAIQSGRTRVRHGSIRAQRAISREGGMPIVVTQQMRDEIYVWRDQFEQKVKPLYPVPPTPMSPHNWNVTASPRAQSTASGRFSQR